MHHERTETCNMKCCAHPCAHTVSMWYAGCHGRRGGNRALLSHEKTWQVPSDSPSKMDLLSPTMEVAAAVDWTAMLC